MVIRILKYLIATVLISGCIEEIDLDITRTSGQLVVFGNVNTSELPQRVQLLRTSGIENRINPVFAAELKLIDEFGNEGCFTAAENGYYNFQLSSINVVPGRSYYLEIRLLSGEIYRSRLTQVPTVTATTVSSSQYTQQTVLSSQQVEVDINIIQIVGETDIDDVSNPFYLRWEVDQTFRLNPTDFPDPFNTVPPPCYIIRGADPQRVNLFNGENITSTSLVRRVLAEREIDYSFVNKHIFTTVTHTINEDAYNFWSQVDELINSTGSIFDVPPATILGNIYNIEDEEERVLGFFELSNTTFDRFTGFQNDVPFSVPETECEFDPNILRGQYPGYCLSCDFFEGGSTVRPDYFDD
ncbi:MAG: DUF4249 family protein [Bacteroidota bacterium]